VPLGLRPLALAIVKTTTAQATTLDVGRILLTSIFRERRRGPFPVRR
jgi:hypothetical protein